MTTPFTAKGDQPLWQAVYDHAVLLAAGDMISYATLADLLGYDPSEPGRSRSPIYAASRRLLTEHDRTLVAVKGKGYRIAYAHEHEGIARGKQRGARRRIRSAVAISTHVDVRQLTPTQRRSLEAVAHVLAAQNAMLSRHDARIGAAEKDIRRVDDRIAALEATLTRHGIEVPGEIVIDP